MKGWSLGVLGALGAFDQREHQQDCVILSPLVFSNLLDLSRLLCTFQSGRILLLVRNKLPPDHFDPNFNVGVRSSWKLFQRVLLTGFLVEKVKAAPSVFRRAGCSSILVDV